MKHWMVEYQRDGDSTIWKRHVEAKDARSARAQFRAKLPDLSITNVRPMRKSEAPIFNASPKKSGLVYLEA